MQRHLAMGTVALILAATTASAQITAYQVKPLVDPAKDFVSPMILDIPVPQLRGVKEAGRMAIGSLREFDCEGVSIRTFVVDQSPFSVTGRTYEFIGSLLVEESFDRFVTLTLALTDGDKRIFAQVTQVDISAEDGETKPFSIRLKVYQAMAEAVDAAENLTLRITMHVRED